MDRLANISLVNRALIALITIMVIGYGAFTGTRLNQELIPSVQFPQVYIIASYPGASPQVMEERVTTPIEQAALTVQGVESSSSTSRDGSATIIVTMKYGSNMSGVQQDMQAALSRIRSFLPTEVDTSVITGGFESFPVLMLSASSSQSPSELAAALNNIAVTKLEKIDGVRSVEVTGAPTRQVQVKLDPAKMAVARVAAAQVSQALISSGGLVSGGTLDNDDKTLSVTIGKRFASVDEIKAVAIPPAVPGAQVVTIGQLATVTEADAPTTSYSRTDGKNSLVVSITKTPDANTVAVADAVKAELDGIKQAIGNDTEFTPVFDQAPFITQSIHDLVVEGGLGLVMAVVVILVFLLSLRSTLVTAVSIPVSVLITLVGLDVADFTLNILTLGAMTIAIGRVVDDSIVVIENIKRHLSYGAPKMQAILTGVREVATAITAATITTVAVFLPIGLVGGQTGELFRPFAFTVTLALLSSLVVSLTIVPVLAYWFLGDSAKVTDVEAVKAEAEAKELHNPLQRAYVPTIKWSLRHPIITLLVAVLLLAGTGALATQLKTNFLGDSGMNTLSVTQEYPPALALAEQDARAQRLERDIRGVAGVQTVQTTVGSNGFNFGFGGSADSASFQLTLDEDADASAVEAEVRKVADKHQSDGDVTVSAQAMQGSSQVEIIIRAADSQRLKEASDAVLAKVKGIANTTDHKSSLAAERPQLQVSLKPEAAAAKGLSEATLAQILRSILTPSKLASMELKSGSTIDVVLLNGDKPVGLAALNAMVIMTPTGPVKLGDVADIKQTVVATSISHYDGQRSVTVAMTPTGDNLGAVNAAVTKALDEVSLPEGATATLGGISQEQTEAFEQLGLALLVAIAIVYVVMVATFKSLIQPLILAVSIPFAATGALAALLITDTPLGVPSLIGMLMLVGIVVTNAIVLIDLVNHYRAEGQSVDDALINGSRQRLRPILMTAVATIFALIPMALGLSGGGVFISKPLAIVVIGGLLSSTLLTLVLVPVLYHLVEGSRERRRLRKAGSTDTEPEPSMAEVIDVTGSEEMEPATSPAPRRAALPD